MKGLIKSYFEFLTESQNEFIVKTEGEINSSGGMIIRIFHNNNEVVANLTVLSLDHAINLDPYVKTYLDLSKYTSANNNIKLNVENAAYIHAIGVSPEFRRMGLASRIKQKAHDEIKSKNYQYALAIVGLTNEPSLSLHNKFGYNVIWNDEKSNGFIKKLY